MVCLCEDEGLLYCVDAWVSTLVLLFRCFVDGEEKGVYSRDDS